MDLCFRQQPNRTYGLDGTRKRKSSGENIESIGHYRGYKSKREKQKKHIQASDNE